MKIGIIGLGNIAKRVANGIQFAQHAELYAVASRNIRKAQEFQYTYGADIAYGSYEELLKDPLVEMVYICTPSPLHYEHIMLCLQFKKHVICEKPFVDSQYRLSECFAYARKQHCFLMEAEKTLFTPLNQKLKKMIEEGEIGQLRYIEASYCAYMDVTSYPKDSLLFDKQIGGAFYDVGVYPICYANYFSKGTIAHVSVMKQNHRYAGIDTLSQAMIGYDNGIMAYVRSSWDLNTINKGYLYGDKGVLITENFWKAKKALLIKNEKEMVIEVEMLSDFTGEIEHAVSCIKKGLLESPILSERESTEILKVLEEMRECNCVANEKSVK